MGPTGAWAVPALIDTLSHQNPRVRALSAMTLGQLGRAALEAKTELAQLQSSDPDGNVRKMAARAFELIGSE